MKIPPPRSILAFRNGSIGNTLVAVPALRALRRSYPDAKLAVVVETLGYELLEQCPWIDRLIVYEKRGQDKSLAAQLRLIHELRSLRPTHAVLFKRFFRNGLLAYLSGAKVRAGFATDGRAPFLNITIPYDESIHHVDMNLRLVERLGAEPAGRELELFLGPEDFRKADAIRSPRIAAGQPYACAHYGGNTWNTERCIGIPQFLELLRRTTGELPVFLIGFGATESAWAKRIAEQMPRVIPAVNLPVRTTAALLQKAELFIGFNSGPSHMAAAVKTPLLMLFEENERTPAQITRWLPPSDTALPLIPPRSGHDTDWTLFFEHAEQAAVQLRRSAFTRL